MANEVYEEEFTGFSPSFTSKFGAKPSLLKAEDAGQAEGEFTGFGSGFDQELSQMRVTSPRLRQAGEEQVEEPPMDAIDFFAQPVAEQSEAMRMAYDGQFQTWHRLFIDNYTSRRFKSPEDYIDWAIGLGNGELYTRETEARIRKHIEAQMLPELKRKMAEKQEGREVEAKVTQNMDRNLRMQKKIDEHGLANIPGYEAGDNIYDAKTQSSITNPQIAKKAQLKIKEDERQVKSEDRRRSRISTLMKDLKSLQVKTGYAPLGGLMDEIRKSMEEELRELLSGGTLGGGAPTGGAPTREQALEELRRRGVI